MQSSQALALDDMQGTKFALEYPMVDELKAPKHPSVTIYVTPIGFICSCGKTDTISRGDMARPRAEIHGDIWHNMSKGRVAIVDYTSSVVLGAGS